MTDQLSDVVLGELVMAKLMERIEIGLDVQTQGGTLVFCVTVGDRLNPAGPRHRSVSRAVRLMPTNLNLDFVDPAQVPYG